MDITRRGFLGRAVAIIGGLGLGTRIGTVPAHGTPAVQKIRTTGEGTITYVPDFGDVRFIAAVPIRTGQLVHFKRKRLHPASAASRRILGVAQNDAHPGETVSVLVMGTTTIRELPA